MKAYEISFRIDKRNKIQFPENLIKVLPKEEDIRAIVLMNEPSEKEFRTEMQTIQGQEYGYSYINTDAVYDDF
ncbi:MAG: hypothetical protein IT279_11235 [Ignavibacteriaceae bacterium]|nr:hypothetical protein [Ignavibacteriaceae bacterium]